MNEFDFNILMPRNRFAVGRRFGKSELVAAYLARAVYAATHLGDLMFPYMKKKHRKMLDDAFIDYITERQQEELIKGAES